MTVSGLDRSAADLPLSYAWPGNLRELNRVVQTAVTLCAGSVISTEAILLTPEATPAAQASRPPADGRPPAHDLSLKTIEREHIRRVLAEVGGNERRAARVLGVSRSLSMVLSRRSCPE